MAQNSSGSMPASSASRARTLSRPTQNKTSRAAAACTRSPSLADLAADGFLTVRLPAFTGAFAPVLFFGCFSSMASL